MTQDKEKRMVIGRSGTEDMLISGRMLEHALKGIFLKTGLDIESAESRAKAYADGLIKDLVGHAPEQLDTIYKLAQAIEEKGDTIAGIIDAFEDKADADHKHNFSEILGKIVRSQITDRAVANDQLESNSVDSRVLENMNHNGMTVGPTSNGSGFKQTITVPQFSVDAQGRITSATERRFEIPELPEIEFPPPPTPENIGAADKEHKHEVGDIIGGYADVGGTRIRFDDLGTELARRPNVDQVNIQAGAVVKLLQANVTEDYMGFYLGQDLVTKVDIVQEEQIDEMLARVFST